MRRLVFEIGILPVVEVSGRREDDRTLPFSKSRAFFTEKNGLPVLGVACKAGLAV